MIYRVFYIPGGAGFLPSTVFSFYRIYFFEGYSLSHSYYSGHIFVVGFPNTNSRPTAWRVRFKKKKGFEAPKQHGIQPRFMPEILSKKMGSSYQKNENI